MCIPTIADCNATNLPKNLGLGEVGRGNNLSFGKGDKFSRTDFTFVVQVQKCISFLSFKTLAKEPHHYLLRLQIG